jgi:hypothetical protein
VHVLSILRGDVCADADGPPPNARSVKATATPRRSDFAGVPLAVFMTVASFALQVPP